MEVLLFLVSRPMEVVSRQELLDAVWPGTFVDEAGVARCVSELRKAFGDNPRTPAVIETIPKRGYRLMTQVSANGPPASAKPRWHLRATLVVALLLTAVVAGRRLVHTRSSPATEVKSIAVLPFRSMGSPAAPGYVLDGMTQMVIAGLTTMWPRRVSSYQSTRRYGSTGKTPAQISRELEVDALLDGTIVSSGDRVRINVELVDGAAGRNIWAGSFERKSGDLFGLQEDVAEAVTAAIEPSLNVRPAGSHAVSSSAYDFYLRGLYHLNGGTDEAAMRQAIGEFQASIAADPRFAEPYARLAICYYALSELWMPPDQAMPKVREAARRALELDGRNVSAHVSLGLVETYYDWNWTAGGNDLRTAVELNPSDALARTEYGRYLGHMGDGAGAVRELELARRLDPLSLDVNRTLGIAYNMAGRYDDAIRQMQHRLAMDSSPGAGRSHLANAYQGKGMYKEALQQLDMIEPADNPWRLAATATLYVKMGRTAEAKALADRLVTMRSSRWVSAYSIAEIEALLGNPRSAIGWLQTAYQERDEGLITLRTDHDLDSLRADPQFREVMAKVFPPAG